ncbi:MAG: ArsR/SmtB family transcription factor [Candidatus Bathyarchaeia archaeon]
MEPTGKFLQIVGNETRRKILTLLSQEPHYISEIAKELEITQPAILKHLSILEQAGLIESFRQDSPLGAARKYYKICHSVGIEVAINSSGFKVKKQPDLTSCANFTKMDQAIKQLTNQINHAQNLTEKASKARELMNAAEILLACKSFEKGKWSCETCHQVAGLKKGTSQIILHMSKGDIESGLRKLMETIDKISIGFDART